MPTSHHNANKTLALGCIADDVTGATDLAINLVQGGMRVVQLLDVPTVKELQDIEADAVVVALKTRSIPKDQAIALSLSALDSLKQAGAKRFYFKYCSTFDSTIEGNIGPVAIALLDATEGSQTIFCPAFPRNGRTVYQGHLFVKSSLLSESGMEHHPLNPMTDPNLVRFLSQQTDEPVGLLTYESLTNNDVRTQLRRLQEQGFRLVIVDSCDDGQLQTLADAVADLAFVTGGSGLARYLPSAYRRAGVCGTTPHTPMLNPAPGRSLILSGSCSVATNRQVQHMRGLCEAWQLNVESILADAEGEMRRLSEWAQDSDPDQPLMVYSTATPESMAATQQQYGRLSVGRAVETFLAQAGAELIAGLGITRLIVAGGETSGAVMQQLGVRSLRIGPEICAGVPWTQTQGEPPMMIALKSGNFGDDDFFAHALEMLP